MDAKKLVCFVAVFLPFLMVNSSFADFDNEFKILAPDGQATDMFGSDVAISGETILIGAESDATSPLNGGSAYIFVFDSTTSSWIQQEKIIPPSPYSNGSFGSSVALDGDLALVGASGDGDTNVSTPPLFSGAAYVYERTGDSWTMVQRLAASDASERDGLGFSIALSGSTVVVGAFNYNADRVGAAYVFTRNLATGVWTEQQKLQPSDGVIGDGFGHSVAIDGDTIIVGAITADPNGTDSGAAYVFTRSGTTWTQQQKLTANDGAANDNFGVSVSVLGDTSFVGAYRDENNSIMSGSTYVFTRSGDVWSQAQKLVASDAINNASFGCDLSISGDNLLIGAYLYDSPTTYHGSAYVFSLDTATGNWLEQQKLTASDGVDNDRYGMDVALNGNRIVIGAYDKNGATGGAYVYTEQVVVPAPKINVTPTSHDFGDVTVQTSSDQTITVTNAGTQDLLVGDVGSSDPLAAPFSILNDNCSGQSVTPSANCTFAIRFAPTTVGTSNDSVDIPSNDPAQDTVTVTVNGAGTAIPVPDIAVTDSVVPDSDLQILFGDVTTGTSSIQSVTIANNGDADLVLGSLATANSLAAPFSLENDTCSGQTLTPAASCTFDVMFAPSGVNSFSDSLDIPSNDPDEAPVTISVSGTGLAATIPDINVSDAVAPNSDLLVPFGSTTIGESTDQVVTVINSGNADLVLGTLATANPLAAPFSIQNNACDGLTLGPAESCAFDVRFSPTVAGTFNESFDIPSNDPDEDPVTINLSGTGTVLPVPDITVSDTVAPLDDLLVPFGDVTEGLTVDQTITLTNDGNADLVFGDIGVANPTAAPFTILNDTCSGQTLIPAANCTIDIRFAPVDTSISNDSFDIPSNDPDENSLTVNLSGTGLTAIINNPPGKPRLVYPADGQQNVPTDIALRWRPVSDPDGDPVSYEVFYCTDGDPFNNCDSVQVTSVNGQGLTVPLDNNVSYAGIGCGAIMLLFGFFCAGRSRGRTRGLLLIVVAVGVGTILAACHTSSNADSKIYYVSGLDSGTSYSWGVVAKDDKGGETKSDVWNFTTQ